MKRRLAAEQGITGCIFLFMPCTPRHVAHCAKTEWRKPRAGWRIPTAFACCWKAGGAGHGGRCMSDLSRPQQQGDRHAAELFIRPRVVNGRMPSSAMKLPMVSGSIESTRAGVVQSALERASPLLVSALDADLRPILCCGRDYKAGSVEHVETYGIHALASVGKPVREKNGNWPLNALERRTDRSSCPQTSIEKPPASRMPLLQ